MFNNGGSLGSRARNAAIMSAARIGRTWILNSNGNISIDNSNSGTLSGSCLWKRRVYDWAQNLFSSCRLITAKWDVRDNRFHFIKIKQLSVSWKFFPRMTILSQYYLYGIFYFLLLFHIVSCTYTHALKVFLWSALPHTPPTSKYD